jgi:adenylate kinase family enzyme
LGSIFHAGSIPLASACCALKVGDPSFSHEPEHTTNAGKLVPAKVLDAMVSERLNSAEALARGWLLDGYPRTSAQAQVRKPAFKSHFKSPSDRAVT